MNTNIIDIVLDFLGPFLILAFFGYLVIQFIYRYLAIKKSRTPKTHSDDGDIE